MCVRVCVCVCVCVHGYPTIPSYGEGFVDFDVQFHDWHSLNPAEFFDSKKKCMPFTSNRDFHIELSALKVTFRHTGRLETLTDL